MSGMMMKTILLLSLSAGFLLSAARGHPMIIELQDSEERCISLNIPEDDDAHLVFLALPTEADASVEWIRKYEDLEQHFLGQIVQLTKSRIRGGLPDEFADESPPQIREIMSELVHEWYGGSTKSLSSVTLTNPRTKAVTKVEAHWFQPYVLNHLRRSIDRDGRKWDDNPLQGYEICLESNNADVPVLMMMDHVMTSDDPYDDADEGAESGMVFKSEHLTPLQDQLDASIRAAQTAVRELNLMERREKRMRKTSDSINWRVRNFSYLSILVLILVTFFQVTYLKRYFRKKKLL